MSSFSLAGTVRPATQRVPGTKGSPASIQTRERRGALRRHPALGPSELHGARGVVDGDHVPFEEVVPQDAGDGPAHDRRELRDRDHGDTVRTIPFAGHSERDAGGPGLIDGAARCPGSLRDGGGDAAGAGRGGVEHRAFIAGVEQPPAVPARQRHVDENDPVDEFGLDRWRGCTLGWGTGEEATCGNRPETCRQSRAVVDFRHAIAYDETLLLASCPSAVPACGRRAYATPGAGSSRPRRLLPRAVPP